MEGEPMRGYYLKHINDNLSFKFDLSDLSLGLRISKQSGYPYYRYKKEIQLLCFTIQYFKR